jgi:hypothetical protein
MRLFTNNTPSNWRQTFEDSVQVDYADIPTGETEKYTNKEGQEKTRMITVERAALGFQTETGRGKGIQWIPVEDIEDALSALQHYAENGVDSVALDDEWLSPAEAIHETISRVPRKDDDGNKIEGEYDISFRVRMGKGSKSCRVPEADFAEFVETLTGVTGAVPDALAKVEAKRAAAAAKAAEAQDGSDE